MNIERLPDLPSIDRIAEALWASGDVRGAAVMVGAGFSRFATPATPDTPALPLWRDFEREMVSALELDPTSSAIPNALRLAEQYQAAFGRPALEAIIRKRVRDDAWAPGSLHKELLRLPWADVLTTNWDTLLERVADGDSEQSYEPILVAGDIARTRAPRITKLHGTFPSLSPFIFTEEDFRTYPSRYAPFVNLALVPEAASSELLQARIGYARAFTMIALGEPVDGKTAVEWGLARYLVTPEALHAEALAITHTLAEKPIGALRATKRLMRDGEKLRQTMDHESAVFAERLKSPEAAEAFRAFAEKRAPNFGQFS